MLLLACGLTALRKSSSVFMGIMDHSLIVVTGRLKYRKPSYQSECKCSSVLCVIDGKYVVPLPSGSGCPIAQ